ncbi:hypothetical protein TrST_g6278 [Triparma strigata]|uniref:Uncharacterized protein n=1 Tax=Triparma strigata TaxID=1606541 RepID=A0A9W7C5V1_9STRA|nr:hypothetical protein TrST_g6278 [Triparma strigata]
MSMVMCLGATRMYCKKSPFISDFLDVFAEVSMWQLFFTMFAALAIRVNLDGERLQDKGYFDVFLTVLQFMPMIVCALITYMNKDQLGDEVKKDKKDIKESFGRAISGGDEGGAFGALARAPVNPLILGGESPGDVEMGSLGKMASIALSDNEGPKRQSSKPAPTVRGSKAPVNVAGGDPKRQSSKPAPTVRGSTVPSSKAAQPPPSPSSSMSELAAASELYDKQVKLVNLKSADLNTRTGTVLSTPISSTGRLQVKLDPISSEPERIISVKLDNIEQMDAAAG